MYREEQVHPQCSLDAFVIVIQQFKTAAYFAPKFLTSSMCFCHFARMTEPFYSKVAYTTIHDPPNMVPYMYMF